MGSRLRNSARQSYRVWQGRNEDDAEAPEKWLDPEEAGAEEESEEGWQWEYMDENVEDEEKKCSS